METATFMKLETVLSVRISEFINSLFGFLYFLLAD